MCVIETKTYVHPNGRREVIESRRSCKYGTASRPCSRLIQRDAGETRIVETRPSSSSSPKPISPVLVTEDKRGRQSTYRERKIVYDMDKPRRKGSIQRRIATSNRPLADGTGSGFSSPRIVSITPDEMPSAPTPPPAAPGFVPSPYGLLGETQSSTLLEDGTAVYEYPPTIGKVSSSSGNGHAAPHPARRPSLSTESTLGQGGGPTSIRRRPSNIITDISAYQSPTTSSPSSSPGLSRIPRFIRGGHERHDSTRGSPLRPKENDDEFDRRQSARESARARAAEQNRQFLAEDDNRRRAEEEEQRYARLQQERYAARDSARNVATASAEDSRDEADCVERDQLRAQAAADRLPRSRLDPVQAQADAEHRARDLEARRAASRERRERHRRETTEALESRETDEDRRRIEAEFEQMRREQRRSEERQRRATESMQREAYEQAQRDAAAEVARTRSSRPRRPTIAEYTQPPSPISARQVTPMRPLVHQSPTSPRGSTLRDRGLDVLEREHARGASERMTAAMGRLSYDDYGDLVDEYAEDTYVDVGLSRTASRRREREARRRVRDQAFWS